IVPPARTRINELSLFAGQTAELICAPDLGVDTDQSFLYSLKYGKTDAVAALAALAQDNRLEAFRPLVQAGPAGMPAGEIAHILKLAPNTLTFHFDRLKGAGSSPCDAKGAR